MSTSTESNFGVDYSPSNVLANSKFPTTTSEFKALGIKYIRLLWLDYTNTPRMRIIPVDYFGKLLSSGGRPGVGVTKATFGLVHLNMTPGFSPTGEYLLVPDLQSFRICGSFAPGHAIIMAYVQEKVPQPDVGLDVPLCPRTLLRRVVDFAAKEAGVSFLIGFETEFILLSQTRPHIVEVNHADWAASAKLPAGQVETVVLEEIADCLVASGIELQMTHAEAAPGQYEVVTGPLPPLEACDALVFTREVIYNVARKHGLRATLAPKVHANSTGSSAHTHVSLHPLRSFPNLTSSPLAPTLSPISQSFLQSALLHLPSICALTLPTSFSYGRMHDGIWSGGTYVGWGIEARETPIRVTGSNYPPSDNFKAGGGQHFEVRCVDGTANPHLAMAGLLGIGSLGVKEGLKLEITGCHGEEALAQMGRAERLKRGHGIRKGDEKSERLPLNIGEARERLRHDEVVKELLGVEFVEKYLAVNQTFEKCFAGGSDNLSKLVEYY
ncbi:glutamine synthetase family protein [Abortiporus biennis]